MDRPNVLIVEDEKRIAHWVKTYFERAGFEAKTAENGTTGLDMALSEQPDLVVLDLMLPGMDGLAVCRTLREETSVPIIIMTARGSEQDKILGLQLGADDYVVKPFSPGELIARAEAVLRRTRGQNGSGQSFRVNGVELDVSAHICIVNGKDVPLSRTQFNLLAVLMKNAGRVLTREQMAQAAFDSGYENYGRTIDVHIRRLRKQIEKDPSRPRRIQTVYGIGYKFCKD